MRLTFLGTAAGKPTRERNVSALALECEQERSWYLFDCGEGTQHQILRSHLSSGKLGTIFISHLHGDHYYGLPGLLSSKKLDRSHTPLTLYGPPGIQAFVDAAINTSVKSLGYELTMVEYAAGDTYRFGHFSVTILPLKHSIDSFAFHINEYDTSNRLDEPKLRSLGLEPSPLYGDLKRGHPVTHNGVTIDPASVMLDPLKGRSVMIAGDNVDPCVMGDHLHGIDLLVHECTYTQDVYDALIEKTLHTTSLDLGKCAHEYRIKCLIATHIGARFAAGAKHDISEISDEIAQNYKNPFFIASDFDRYEIKRDGVVKL